MSGSNGNAGGGEHGPSERELDAEPAVFVLDDGRRAELPELTLREAMEVVKLAAELGELVGGDLDPARIVGYEVEGGDPS